MGGIQRTTRNGAVLAGAIAVLVGVLLLNPPFDGLSVAAWRAFGLLVFGIVLWATEAMPITITGLLVIALTPLLGLMPLEDVWPSAIGQAFFFVIASFGLCAGVMNTNLAQRIMRMIFRRIDNNPKHIVYGFVGCTALISVFITDAGTNMMMLALSLSFFSCVGIKDKNDNALAKCIMIGISAGSMTGGIATPASNSINMLALGMMEESVGVSIGFLEWAVVGVPLAIVTTLICMFSLVAVFKPQPLDDKEWRKFIKLLDDVGSWTAQETKFVVILAGMVACWIAGTWIPQLSIAIVAIVGVSLMVMPGVELFSGLDFTRSIQVTPMILFPSASVLAAVVTTTGLGSWLVGIVFSSAALWPTWAVLLVISAVACAAHVVIPAGPAAIGVTGAAMFSVAATVGADPVVVLFILAYWGGATYLLPIDGLMNVPYAYGYYQSKELMAWGTIPSFLGIVVVVAVVAPLCQII